MFQLRMIAGNVENIRSGIAQACRKAGRKPESVLLVAVAKTFPPEMVAEAVRAGVCDIGENYVQELIEKRLALPDPGIRWHFIGHLQSNKVKQIAGWIHLIHAVDSASLARELARRASTLGRTVDVLIEVNTSGETTKFGVKPEETLKLVKEIGVLKGIRLRGLMTLGPFVTDPEISRKAFRSLRLLRDEANAAGSLPEPLTELSMGMTHDYETAIEEGATIVRIGTAIFGSRRRPAA